MNAEIAGANPVGPPSSILDFGFWILDCRIGPEQISIRTLPIQNPKSKIQNAHGAVAERLMHFAVDEDDDGSSPFGPANYILDFRFWILDFGLSDRRR